MKARRHRPVIPCQSGRQESNLPFTAYQTVAAPLGFGPKRAPCTGIEPVSPVRQTGWHASFITGLIRAPGGSRTHLSTLAGWCLDRSATGASSSNQQQGRKESNPLRLLWRQAALPGAHPCRTAEGTGLEPARAVRLARFPTGCHRASWLALPYRSCPGRARTCNRLVNSQPHHRCATGQSVRMAGFEPALSGTPSRRIARLSYILSEQFRRLGSNQRPPRFQRGALTV